MSLIDRRKSIKIKGEANRKRFMDAHKYSIKEKVEKLIAEKSLKSLADKKQSIRIRTTEEHQFRHKSDKYAVIPGNHKYRRNDKFIKRSSDDALNSYDGEPGDDDFRFTLTKEEFLDYFFENMELPNFIKKGLLSETIMLKKRGGYTKFGIPARLSIKKTFEQALARKIANKGYNGPFLDDTDLRYYNLISYPKPIKKAVLFCVMDTSGSMDEENKMLGKKFFLLLYIFLFKSYDDVEIRFIRHDLEAEEVSEKEFFYGTRTGGTYVYPALELVNHIIDEEYSLAKTNCYLAQVSDGDIDVGRDKACATILENTLLDKLQYMAYIEITSRHPDDYDLLLSYIYKTLEDNYRNFKQRKIQGVSDIFPVLYDLFKKE